MPIVYSWTEVHKTSLLVLLSDISQADNQSTRELDKTCIRNLDAYAIQRIRASSETIKLK